MSREIEDYKAENDDLGEFMEEKVEALSKDFSIHKTKLLAAYNQWAKANGLSEMDIKELQSKMRQKGYRLETNAAKTARGFYRGLGLMESAEEVRYDVRRDRE
jgi:phage/plasmid-associated DNA primase